MAKKKSFEDSLHKLENIIKEMESGIISIEESVKKYEEGMKHSKLCMDILDKTEKKISQISKDESGKLIEKPFKNE